MEWSQWKHLHGSTRCCSQLGLSEKLYFTKQCYIPIYPPDHRGTKSPFLIVVWSQWNNLQMFSRLSYFLIKIANDADLMCYLNPIVITENKYPMEYQNHKVFQSKLFVWKLLKIRILQNNFCFPIVRGSRNRIYHEGPYWNCFVR